MSTISFSIVDSGVRNTIFAPTTKASQNSISLIISADTDLALAKSQPVPYGQAMSATGTLFYIKLAPLGLSEAELGAILVTATGFDAVVYPDNSMICLAPTADTTLQAGTEISVGIGNVVISTVPPGSIETLYADFFRAAPVSSGLLPFTYSAGVTFQAPPSGKLDLHDDLQISLSPGTVVQSISDNPNVRNSLLLTLSPGAHPKVIKAGPKTTFTVGFVYAVDTFGYGALSTPVQAINFGFNPGQDASKWTVTPPNKGAQSPTWLLQPASGAAILGPTNTVTFNITNIITTFQAGPTLMIIAYKNVPGYADGSFTLVIEKEAHVYVSTLSATPNPVVLNKGTGQVTLSWTASGSQLTLLPTQQDVTGKSGVTVEVSDETQFTLLAQGDNVKNVASRSVTIETFPNINAFSAAPKKIYASDFPNTVLLDWDVNTTGGVQLSSSISGQSVNLPAHGTHASNLSRPQMLTIAPAQNDTLDLIERNQIIYAYNYVKYQNVQTTQPALLLLSPTMNLCVVINVGASGSAAFLDTISLALLPAPGIAIDTSATHYCGAFSPDGQRLFLANDKGAFTVYSITIDSASGSYAATALANSSTAGAIADLQVSPDGHTLYLLANSTGGKPGSLIVFTTTDNSRYTLSSSTSLTASTPNSHFQAVAVLPSGAQAFVLEQGDTPQIQVLGYQQSSKSYLVLRAITGFSSGDKPFGIALAGYNASTLLVSCSGSKNVYAVAITSDTVSTAQSLQVGVAPTDIAVTQDGTYALVVNAGDGTASVLSCNKGANLCAVVGSPVQIGTRPAALTFTPDGDLAYIGTSTGITILSTQTYQFETVLGSATLATSVAASSTQVTSWHNFTKSINAGGMTPSPGLYVYDIQAQTTSPMNQDVDYTVFAYWPDESRPFAIAGVKGDNAIKILNTTTFATDSTIALSAPAGSSAVALDITSLANTAFIVMRDPTGGHTLSICDYNKTSGAFTVSGSVPLYTETASSQCLIASTSNGSSIFIVNTEGKTLYVVEKSATGTYALQSTPYTLPSLSQSMVITPDNGKLYIWLSENAASAFGIFDIAAMQLSVLTIPNASSLLVLATAISPDGERIYAADVNAGGVRVFSTKSLQNIDHIVFTGTALPYGVAVAPDGSAIYTANALSGNLGIAQQIQPEASASQGGLRQCNLLLPAPIPALSTDTYNGIFVRDYVGESPSTTSGSGWTMSPDIIPYGTSLMPDPSVLGQLANYGTDYAHDITLDQVNYLYYRGYNTAPGVQASRIYTYWAFSEIFLTPAKWLNANMAVNRNPQNYLDVKATTNGEIVYTATPVSWTPLSSLGNHFCLIAWVDNDPNPTPPNLNQWSFTSWDDLGQFILDHPNVAWRNTNDISASGAFLNAQTGVTGPSGGGSVLVGLKLSDNIAQQGGTISFTVMNSDGTLNYNSPQTTISSNTVAEFVNWPANGSKDATITYTYSPAGGTLQAGMVITAYTGTFGTSALMKEAALRAPHMVINPENPRLGDTQMLLVGSVNQKYTGS